MMLFSKKEYDRFVDFATYGHLPKGVRDDFRKLDSIGIDDPPEPIVVDDEIIRQLIPSADWSKKS
jgi:hypothetical protein